MAVLFGIVWACVNQKRVGVGMKGEGMKEGGGDVEGEVDELAEMMGRTGMGTMEDGAVMERLAVDMEGLMKL